MKLTQLPIIVNNATTGHKLQGVSADNLYVHDWSTGGSNWNYVVLSRVRKQERLYAKCKLPNNPFLYEVPSELAATIMNLQFFVPAEASVQHNGIDYSNLAALLPRDNSQPTGEEETTEEKADTLHADIDTSEIPEDPMPVAHLAVQHNSRSTSSRKFSGAPFGCQRLAKDCSCKNGSYKDCRNMQITFPSSNKEAKKKIK